MAWVPAGSIKGPPGNAGPPGSQGPQGPTGPAGEKWFQGAGAPSGSLIGSVVGDWYIDTTTGDFYEKTGTSTWTLRGNLKGPTGATGNTGSQGIQGVQGTPGSTWYSQAGAPAAGTGIVGDYSLNTTTGDVYKKTGTSTWTLQGNIKGPTGATGNTGSQGIQGPAGADGEKWFTGSGAPPTGTGVVGDWFLRSDTGDYYEKTGSASWTLRGNLTGPTGADGLGVPTGGAIGALLRKKSATNNDTEWSNRVKGTATNDNAAAGDVGEVISSVVPLGSAVTQTTATVKNIASIVLTAGDWDVRGVVEMWFNGLAASTYGTATADISPTSATIVSDGQQCSGIVTSITANLSVIVSLPLPARRFSLASTTTLYLIARPVFATAACAAYGYIEARRMR